MPPLVALPSISLEIHSNPLLEPLSDEKWLRYDVASGIDAMSVDVFPQVNPVEVAIWGACTRIYSMSPFPLLLLLNLLQITLLASLCSTCAANTLCQLPFDTNATRSVSVLFIKITPQVGKTTRTRVSVSYGINVCQDISNQTADVKFCMDSLDLTATYSIRTRLSVLDANAEARFAFVREHCDPPQSHHTFSL